MVEPVDVGERGELDVLEPRPWPLGVDQLPLVEAVEALGEAVGPRRQRHPILQVMSEAPGVWWRLFDRSERPSRKRLSAINQSPSVGVSDFWHAAARTCQHSRPTGVSRLRSGSSKR